MIVEETKTYYVLTVNGQPVSSRCETLTLIELAKQKLSPEHQAIAEVTQVADDGKQVLRG